ncbi:hypothetical protein F5Y19DRAFT_473993 [Xylariaceae sp. FL1651]|nr:hypothetical protein F5Y19DRAFT_473993 [Xylariaceae sp. FL1651]
MFHVIVTAIAEAYREALSDLRSKGVSLALGAICAAWVLGLFVALAILLLFGLLPSLSLDTEHPSACHPDGAFNLFGQTYNPWAASGFFQINLGFGDLTFTSVKTIDIVWDVVVGRGGQAALAFVSWRVFTDYIATSVVKSPITYSTYITVFLQSGPSITSIYRLVKDYWIRRGLDSRAASTFVVWNMLFILGWPTFSGAATGYAPTTKPFILAFDGNYVPFSYFLPLAYVIHDGWRINLTGDYPVPLIGNMSSGDPIIYSHDLFKFQLGSGCRSNPDHDLWFSNLCSLQAALSKYVASYGFYNATNSETVWNEAPYVINLGVLGGAGDIDMSTRISAPSLDIEAFSIDPENWDASEVLYGWDWTDPQSHGHSKPFQNRSRTSWTFSNQTYSLSYMESNGQCQPTQNKFRWGFSFLQVFILVVSLLVWTFGTCILWLKSYFRLPFQAQLEVPRGYTALLLIAETIEEQLDQVGLDAISLTNRQMKAEIQKSLQGGAFSLKASPQHETLHHWIKKERIWLCALSVDMVATLTLIGIDGTLLGGSFGSYPPISLAQIAREWRHFSGTPWGVGLNLATITLLFYTTGTCIAIAIGKSQKSRVFLVSCLTSFGITIGSLVSL